MPHDCKGQEVKVGQVVSVLFKVEAVHAGPTECNVSLAALERVSDSSRPSYLPGVTMHTRNVQVERPAEWEQAAPAEGAREA